MIGRGMQVMVCDPEGILEDEEPERDGYCQQVYTIGIPLRPWSTFSSRCRTGRARAVDAVTGEWPEVPSFRVAVYPVRVDGGSALVGA
ncbi:MAG: hypothetical protein EXQ81_07970 [Thermoleophilia bacterium]|nr:hypothetical protein [Thermoleophilia bacterium]